MQRKQKAEKPLDDVLNAMVMCHRMSNIMVKVPPWLHNKKQLGRLVDVFGPKKPLDYR